MNMERHRLKWLMLSVMLVSCVGHELAPESSVSEEQFPIRVSGSITQIHTTKVSDNGFADGDEIGVYVVNYENGQAGTMSSTGNQVTNVRHTYDAAEEAWEPDYPIYWKDRTTLVDAYGYYPYIDDIADVRAIPFVVSQNQSDVVEELGISGYEASDFLWAKTSGVRPSSQMIYLNHRHIMAGVQVTLVQGEGFTAEDWDAAEKIVMVENTIPACHIDISDGAVIVDENADPKAITPADNSGDWRAVVVPQMVDQGKTLISITVNGYSYYHTLDEMMTYHPGKLHKYTIMVHNSEPDGDYRFEVLDEAVTAWESDEVSHSGKVMEYVVINVPTAGTLPYAVARRGLSPGNIINLKLTGELTDSDFGYIRENMPYLECVNLYECKIRNCRFAEHDENVEDDVLPCFAFMYMHSLRSCVFPKDIRKIGQDAFSVTQLSGSLIIPDGVTHIGDGAFERKRYGQEISNHLNGTLSLPSTLEYIGSGAFGGCRFTGDLSIPDNVSYIGSAAFADCDRMTGRLIIPSKITEIPKQLFSGTTNLIGVIEIPKGVKIINEMAFRGAGITGVVFPEGLERINKSAFENSRLEGELLLPSSMAFIGASAFSGTDITSIYFSDNIDVLSEAAFYACRHLQDTLHLPSALVRMEPYVFECCEKLEAVVFPKKLERIGERAFAECYSLGYIHSDAIEPPVWDNGSVFDGVPKDNFTIEVPDAAVYAYRSANGWNEFKRISAYRGFVCRPSFANVLNAGGTRELILNAPANTDWSVIYCPEWCRLSADSGTGKAELTLTIDEMEHGYENRVDRIILKLDDEEEYLTYIDVGQYDYEFDEDEQVDLQRATKGDGIDIFIVGDGYDAVDISSGLYLDDMRQGMEYFFGVEPYKTYREYFNFHTAIALSYESGIGTVNSLRNVKFETNYGNGTWESRISGNAADVVKYAIDNVEEITAEKVDRLTAILIPNADVYDGVCEMWSNGTSVAFCPKSNAAYPYDARGIIQHEAGGHGFGKLADEYIYHYDFIQTCGCYCCGHVDDILAGHHLGWYRNISLEGKFKNVEWNHLIYDSRYNDIVDIYEGAFYHKRGVYRSELNSCMNNNVPYFSTISRQAIVERIMEYAGEEFSYEEFVANDSRDWGVDFTDQTQTKGQNVTDFSVAVYCHQPIIIEGSPLD